MNRVVLIDYGTGNLASLENAFRFLGVNVERTGDAARIRKARRLVLPGVGAFGPAMQRLRNTGLDRVIQEKAASGTPVLGICLGMQLLFTFSEEDGMHEGLNLIPGSVRKLDVPLKIPHMGWNTLALRKESYLTSGVASGASVYFVHSYVCVPDDPADILAETDYSGAFCAAAERGCCAGVQFHPEKSQRTGLRLLDNFTRQDPADLSRPGKEAACS